MADQPKTRRGLRRAAKGTPGGTGRKASLHERRYLTRRELTVLQAIADAMPLTATPFDVSRELDIGIGYTREVARRLNGKGLIVTQRGFILHYKITDAGLRELNGNG